MKKSNMLIMLLVMMVIIAGCKKTETTEEPPLDTTEHDNRVQILPEGFSPTMTYAFSGNYSITDKQPWSGVSSSTVVVNGSNALEILAKAGRKGTAGPAEWFASNVSAATCTDESWTTMPEKLNFAFTGTLTIDGNSYPVTLGQGHATLMTDNDWWIGGPGWTSGNNTVYTPDGKYLFFGNVSSSDYQFGIQKN